MLTLAVIAYIINAASREPVSLAGNLPNNGKVLRTRKGDVADRKSAS
jgi:hypothetical protein